MTRLWLGICVILGIAGFAQGQQAFETLDLLDSSGTFRIRLVAPGTLSGDSQLTLPVPTGSPGCVVDSGGSGVLTIAACTLTPPVLISGSTGGDILTVTQSGAGGALTVNGTTTLTATTVGTVLNITQSGSGSALTVNGSSQFLGLITSSFSTPLWYFQPNGVGFARNFTSRYTFDSLGDVAQTGSFTASGSLITPTSGSFDVSFTGGTLGLCTTTCTTSNQIPVLVTCVNDSANKCGGSQPQGTIVVTPSPGFNGFYTYSANAFQTSRGTMYITGDGFGYFQNLAATNGFTSYGIGTISGSAAAAGGSIVWVSGTFQFNPSMVGGIITIAGTPFTITGFSTPTRLTTSTGGSASGTFNYTADAFRVWNGTFNLASIDSAGAGNFQSLNVGGVGLGFGGPTLGSNIVGGQYQARLTGTTSRTLLVVSNSGAGLDISAANASFTNLTVSSCTGCGGGGTGTVTSIATTSPITGGTITTTGTIGCSTCITTSTSKLMQSGISQFSGGTKTVNPTGLSATNVCTANQAVVGTPTEFVGVSAVSGTSATFTSSNPTSSSFFHWDCTN